MLRLVRLVTETASAWSSTCETLKMLKVTTGDSEVTASASKTSLGQWWMVRWLRFLEPV